MRPAGRRGNRDRGRLLIRPIIRPKGVGPYRRDSECRKPRPGMLLAAARDLALDLPASFAIGDKKSDVAAGRAAGCRTILVETGHGGRGEPELAVEPDAVARDLEHAAQLIAHWPVSSVRSCISGWIAMTTPAAIFKSYLVTGGAGFIGSHVVAALADRGDDVTVCDTLGSGDKWRNLAKHELAGFVHPDGSADYLAGNPPLDVIFHMGAISSTTETDGDLVIRSNFELTRRGCGIGAASGRCGSSMPRRRRPMATDRPASSISIARRNWPACGR